jgi:DNA end-binding protein Ku
MARALWSGSLSFGLVNVPVQLFSAVHDKDLHFRQLHEKDGSPIETRRFCSDEDREVAYEDVGQGYELDDGKAVVLSDEELAAAAPRRTRTIDIEAFVDLADVDPIYFDHPYFLLPQGEAEGSRRAYQLLVEVMRGTDRAALGRFVLRTKGYLVAVRVRDDLLSLTTMRFHDEVRPTRDIPGGGRKPANERLDRNVALVEALSVDWDPSRYEDRYRQRLLDVIERKKKGERITIPEDGPQASPVPDLMAALEQSLQHAKGGGNGQAARVGDGEELGKLSREQLYERAQEADIAGRSSMSKKQLVDALGKN